jgi:hypothetical protein
MSYPKKVVLKLSNGSNDLVFLAIDFENEKLSL